MKRRIFVLAMVMCLVLSTFVFADATSTTHAATCHNYGAAIDSDHYTANTEGYDCWCNPYWTLKCKLCDYTFKYNRGQKEHEWEYITIQPTCTTAGGNAVRCIVCGHIYVYQETSPALGHNWTETRREPTCTRSGWTQDVCQRCFSYGPQNVIPALGHDSKEHVVDAIKLTYEICDRCGDYGSSSIQGDGNCFGGTVASVSSKGSAVGNCSVRAYAMSYNPTVPFAALKYEDDATIAYIPGTSITKGVALKPETGKNAEIIIDNSGTKMTLTAGEKDMAVALIDICEIKGNDYIPFAKAIVEDGVLANVSTDKTANGDFCLKTEKGTTLAIPGGSAQGSGNAFVLSGNSASITNVKLKSKPQMPAIICDGNNGLQFNYIRGATVGSLVNAAPESPQKSVITFN